MAARRWRSRKSSVRACSSVSRSMASRFRSTRAATLAFNVNSGGSSARRSASTSAREREVPGFIRKASKIRSRAARRSCRSSLKRAVLVGKSGPSSRSVRTTSGNATAAWTTGGLRPRNETESRSQVRRAYTAALAWLTGFLIGWRSPSPSRENQSFPRRSIRPPLTSIASAPRAGSTIRKSSSRSRGGCRMRRPWITVQVSGRSLFATSRKRRSEAGNSPAVHSTIRGTTARLRPAERPTRGSGGDTRDAPTRRLRSWEAGDCTRRGRTRPVCPQAERLPGRRPGRCG